MAIIAKQVFEQDPLTFGLELSEQDDRLDCSWHNPIVEDKIDNLRGKKNRKRKLVKLKSVASVDGGKRLPKGTTVSVGEAAVIPYVRATDVKDLKVNVDTSAKIPKEIHQVIQNYQLKKSDIVITVVGTIGEVGILEKKVEVCDFTENIARVRLEDMSVLPNFLLHFLDSEYGNIQTERHSVGSLQFKLSLQSCRNLEIYIPFFENSYDKSEQNKILNNIYSIFDEAEVKKKESNQLINDANEVVKKEVGLTLSLDEEDTHFGQLLDGDPLARLDVLFNNPAREKLLLRLKKYPHQPLGKLIKLRRGKKIIPSDFYRLIELEQIDEYTGRIVKTKEVPQLESDKILLQENDILISKLQPEKGKIVIVNNKYDGCAGSSELVPLVLNSTDVTIEYLWAVLRSEYVLKQWEYELHGSSRMRIGPNEIENTIIPIPNKKIQNKIVNEISEKIEKSDQKIKESNDLFIKAKEQFIDSLLG